MNQLDAADLLKRTRELDARELALIEKENILSDTLRNTDITVLEEIYKVKQQQITTQQSKINALKEKYNTFADRYRRSLKTLEIHIEDLKEKIHTHSTKLADIKLAIYESTKVSNATKQDIIEQQRYYKEQERITQNTISEWNVELQQFSKAISDAHEQKATLLKDNAQLEYLKVEKERDAEESRKRLELLEEKFAERSEELRNDLKAIGEKIRVKNTKMAELTKDSERRSRGIQIREKELAIKEQTITERERGLVMRERRIQSLELL